MFLPQHYNHQLFDSRDSPGLITLELQHNPLDKVDDYLLNCRTLLYLDISSCNINSLSTKFFHNTTNLNKLDLSDNPLESIIAGPFDYLTNLEYLTLNNCSLTDISPLAFLHLENLRHLAMSNNNLKTITWTHVLAPLVRLEHLDLGRTGITNLPGDAFAKNHYLRELVLAHNELHHLDVENTLGHNLHNLQALDLSHCALQERLSEDAFRNASKLRVLNLSGNPMFAGDLTAVLRHLPTLHKLSLSDCNLKRLPDAFDVLKDLEELDISHNPLSDAFVRLLKPLRSLEFLDMSYCDLGYVGNNTFAYMTELRRLILSGNKLHTLEQDLFKNLTRLESLELNNCDLRAPLDPKVFGTGKIYSTIIELKLSGNPLTIPREGPLLPKQLSSVELLDLSNCKINHLNENIFSRNKNLTQLNLSSNELASIESLTFLKKLRRLEHLNLSYNNLSNINPKVFKVNSHLLSLNLIGNPFTCNCSIQDMWDWAVHEKNDLGILVGSQMSDFPTGGVKIRKSLSCTYDADAYRAIINQSNKDKRPFIRKGDLQPGRTWAKYIRESNCAKKL